MANSLVSSFMDSSGELPCEKGLDDFHMLILTAMWILLGRNNKGYSESIATTAPPAFADVEATLSTPPPTWFFHDRFGFVLFGNYKQAREKLSVLCMTHQGLPADEPRSRRRARKRIAEQKDAAREAQHPSLSNTRRMSATNQIGIGALAQASSLRKIQKLESVVHSKNQALNRLQKWIDQEIAVLSSRSSNVHPLPRYLRAPSISSSSGLHLSPLASLVSTQREK
jgi:hypothetical protein